MSVELVFIKVLKVFVIDIFFIVDLLLEMIGVRMVNGMASTRTKIGISARFSATVTKFATYIDPMRPQTKSASFWNKSGPGRSPQMIMPPSRKSVWTRMVSPSWRLISAKVSWLPIVTFPYIKMKFSVPSLV